MFSIDLYQGFITHREDPGTIIYFYLPTAVVRVVASFCYYLLVSWIFVFAPWIRSYTRSLQSLVA